VNRATSRLRRFGSRAGSSMVEFALGSGILVTIFVSTFQYGYFFYQYNLLVNVVNNAAHFAAMQVYDSNSTAPSTAWTTAVRKMALYGDPTGTSTTLQVKNLTNSNISITVAGSGSGSTFTPTSMTVAITGYTIDGVTGKYVLTGKPAVTYPFQGLYCPDTGC
jgi:Flp pilus assembly protein TadG